MSGGGNESETGGKIPSGEQQSAASKSEKYEGFNPFTDSRFRFGLWAVGFAMAGIVGIVVAAGILFNDTSGVAVVGSAAGVAGAAVAAYFGLSATAEASKAVGAATATAMQANSDSQAATNAVKNAAGKADAAAQAAEGASAAAVRAADAADELAKLMAGRSET